MKNAPPQINLQKMLMIDLAYSKGVRPLKRQKTSFDMTPSTYYVLLLFSVSQHKRIIMPYYFMPHPKQSGRVVIVVSECVCWKRADGENNGFWFWAPPKVWVHCYYCIPACASQPHFLDRSWFFSLPSSFLLSGLTSIIECQLSCFSLLSPASKRPS